MTHFLWPLVSTQVAPELLNSTRHAQIARDSSRLPDVPRIGFEIRLADDDDRTDTLSYLLPSEILADDHDAGAGALGNEPVSRRLRNAFARLSDHQLACVEEVFLEFDATRTEEQADFPAVFFTFTSTGVKLPETEKYILAKSLLSAYAGQDVNLARAPGTLLSVGYMHGRSPRSIRLNYLPTDRELSRQFLSTHLEKDSIERIESLLNHCLAMTGRCVIAVDLLGDTLLPRIGLEVSFPVGERKRQGAFISWLAEQGYCGPLKARAMKMYPSLLTPLKVGRQWPDELLALSLLGPPERFVCLLAAISHFKLVIVPEKGVQAKCYLGISEYFAHSSELDGSVGY